MTLQNDISLELLTIAPYLATVERANPFRVPFGYFNQLAQSTIDEALERDELEASAPVTMALSRENGMSVPEGYFEELLYNTLAQTLETEKITVRLPDEAINAFTVPTAYFEQLQANILLAAKDAAEDDECSTQFLESITSNEGFTTPPQYFETLQGEVLHRINNLNNEEDGLTTAAIDEIAAEPAFALPPNYFAELQEGIMAAISTEDYNSEILEEVGKATVFTVPEDYFAELQQQVMHRINAETEQPLRSKTVTMPSQQKQVNTIFKYALRIAAVLSVLFLGWQLLNQGPDTPQQTAMLAPSPQLLLKMENMKAELGITSSDMAAYISSNAEEFAAMDWDTYMNIAASGISIKEQASKSINLTPEAMDLLDISTDEIEDFLSE